MGPCRCDRARSRPPRRPAARCSGKRASSWPSCRPAWRAPGNAHRRPPGRRGRRRCPCRRCSRRTSSFRAGRKRSTPCPSRPPRQECLPKCWKISFELLFEVSSLPTRGAYGYSARCETTPVRSGRERGQVGGERDHVLEGEILDGGLHLRARDSRAGAVLEVVELPEEVGRRAAGESGNQARALQFRPMAARAVDGLARAAARGERLAPPDDDWREAGDEAGVRVPALEVLEDFGHLDDALAQL